MATSSVDAHLFKQSIQIQKDFRQCFDTVKDPDSGSDELEHNYETPVISFTALRISMINFVEFKLCCMSQFDCSLWHGREKKLVTQECTLARLTRYPRGKDG